MAEEAKGDPRQDGLLDLMLGPAFALGGYLLGQAVSYGCIHGVRLIMGRAIIGAGLLLGVWYLFRAVRELAAAQSRPTRPTSSQGD